MPRRPQLLLFLLCWITFGWFHQGGGWNQNARFAEVRAIVEQGRFAIDDYLVYELKGEVWERARVERGVIMGGSRKVLAWPAPGGEAPVAVTGDAHPVEKLAVIGEATASGDIGFAPDGHFHPNKPPGTSLLAVPVYFIAFHAERALGFNPDHWWVLNLNLWLCSLFTVGLVSAAGVVLVWRLGLDLFPGHSRAALAAALTFGFGTTFFPFATLLFDHNLTAVFLLGAFAAVRADRPVMAGALAGVAAVTNYLAAIPGAAFGVWALLRNRRHALRYIFGVVPAALALLAYNAAALGSPFALNTSFQNPMFKETAPALLGMFTLPSWFAAEVITISPWRGVFVLSPALLLALLGLIGWPARFRAERRLIAGICVFFFSVNICFNGFHGGMAAGPRYLIPALPFLCLALVPVYGVFWKTSAVLMAVSVVQQALLTATDALNPVGVSDHAWQDHPDEWKEKLRGNSIVWRYAWPLFSEGRAWRVIEAEFQEHFMPSQRDMPPEDMRTFRAWGNVERGEPKPVPLAAMPGPVSVNVVQPAEGGFFQETRPHSAQAEWAAFNAGEFFFPQSRWSLAPLLALWLPAGLVLFWRRKPAPQSDASAKN